MRLHSAPLNHFDPMLLSLVPQQWRKLVGVLGDALARAASDGYEHTSDLVLEARLRALVQDGLLVGRGMDQTLHEAEIKLSK